MQGVEQSHVKKIEGHRLPNSAVLDRPQLTGALIRPGGEDSWNVEYSPNTQVLNIDIEAVVLLRQCNGGLCIYNSCQKSPQALTSLASKVRSTLKSFYF